MATDSIPGRFGPSDTARWDIARCDPTGIGTRTRPMVPPLPDGVRRARSAGRPWAIRIACLWDTIERYDSVRCRHDRLPAHHLVCDLAGAMRQLAADDVAGQRAAWSTIAARLDAACSDPLGEEPAAVVAQVIDLVTGLADDTY